jgi:hypothetical protein
LHVDCLLPNMRLKFSILVFCFSALAANAQRFAEQIPQIKRYTQKEVLDSAKGIVLFNRLVSVLGGDSVKYNKQGYNIQGWNEEYYLNGSILHKGYYVDGKIKVFKNYYENGQLERSLVNPDPLHAILNLYFENGQPRQRITYYDGKPQKSYEYYENGLPKLHEEKEKDLRYTTNRREWNQNGQLLSEFELVDLKDKKFKSTVYYSNGNVKEQGFYTLAQDGLTIEKSGTWQYFDEKGKKIKS